MPVRLEFDPDKEAVNLAKHGMLTVRFTLRGEAIRVIGAGYWRKQKKAYENQTKETDLR